MAVPVTAIVFWRPAADPFQLPKATALMVLALAALGLVVAQALVDRRLEVPWSPIVAVGAAMLVISTVAAAVSDNPVVAFIGESSLYGGVVTTAALFTLFVSGLRTFGSAPQGFQRAVTVGAALVAGYGLLQAIGADPYEWANPLLEVFSTMSNPNFLAGWAGIALPLVAVPLLCGRRDRLSLGVHASIVFALAVVAAASGSFQGPVTVGAGAAVTGGAWLLRVHPRVVPGVGGRRWPVLLAAGSIVVIGAVMVPAVRSRIDQGMVERTHFWRAAVATVVDRPVLGVGPDLYANRFFEARSGEHAVGYNLSSAEAAHSVPLQTAANGGVLLLALYFVFVSLTGYVLFRALATADRESWPLMAGLAGAWTAYQVQSLVSIDVPALATLNWMLTALVWVLAAPPRTILLGTRPADTHPSPSGKGRRRTVPAALPTATVAGLVAVIMIGAALAWLVLRPLRGDIAGSSGAELATQGQFDGALAKFEDAHRLMPWESLHWYYEAGTYEFMGRVDDAIDAAERAAALEPGFPQYPLMAARLAVTAGQEDRAIRWYREAAERDPSNPSTLEVVAYHIAIDEPELALEYVERASRYFSDRPRLVMAEALAYQALGEKALAKAGFEEVVERFPASEEAVLARARLESNPD